eukprot:15348011-Ditylum_brightwellii.AAC.1
MGYHTLVNYVSAASIEVEAMTYYMPPTVSLPLIFTQKNIWYQFKYHTEKKGYHGIHLHPVRLHNFNNWTSQGIMMNNTAKDALCVCPTGVTRVI